METTEGMIIAGVTVIGAEAPSAYHVAPRAENPAQDAYGALHATPMAENLTQAAALPAGDATRASVGVDGSTGKKKRGRPKKYVPGEAVTMEMSPMPAALSASSTSNLSSGKRGRGRGRGRGRSGGSEPKQHEIPAGENEYRPPKRPVIEAGGDWSAIAAHMADMASHVIIAQPGQDIATMLLLLAAQYSPHGICIMSGIGEISSVDLGTLDPAVGGTTKLEGCFDIIKLSGNFIPYYGQGTTGGGIDVVLVDQADPERLTISGPVRGCLRAATPVQIVLGIFLPGQPTVNPKGAPIREPEAVAPAAETAPAEEGQPGWKWP